MNPSYDSQEAQQDLQYFRIKSCSIYRLLQFVDQRLQFHVVTFSDIFKRTKLHQVTADAVCFERDPSVNGFGILPNHLRYSLIWSKDGGCLHKYADGVTPR